MQHAYRDNFTKLQHRKDINGLRFIAVFSVVSGHYFPNLVPQGFLGVDIFFVISGYVITQLLFKMEKESASSFLIEFYGKRIRRLIPALLFVVTVSLLAFSLLVIQVDEAVSKTGAYALLGVSNIYLWRYGPDYFSLPASQNPFTHTWSLGVEEQFYALYPIFFFLCWKLTKERRFMTLVMIVGTTSFLSLILNIGFTDSKTNFVFYSMPTRFWELGAGVLVSLLVSKNVEIGNKLGNYRLFVFLILLSIFFLNSGIEVCNQIIAVMATSYLLFPGSKDIATNFLSNDKINWIGDRSYSIYLIHWPVLVLANYLFGLGVFKNVLCIIVTVLLSALVYRFIENPFRMGRFKVSAISTITLGLPIVILATAIIYFGSPRISQSSNNLFPNFLGVKEVPGWKTSKCSSASQLEKIVSPIHACLGGSKGSNARFVYLIGDSHADQLLSMVRASFLAPHFEVRNLNTQDGTDFPFGDLSANTNSPSLKFLELNAKSGDLVVLAFHRGHLNSSRDEHIPLTQNVKVTPETKNLINNLDNFSVKMSLIGVKVILIKDTPLMASIQSSESCALQLKLFKSNGCKVSRVQDTKTRFLQSYAFEHVAKNNQNVFTWDPFDAIYGNSRSFDVVDNNGNYLMWDWNHITPYLSMKLAPNFMDSIEIFIKSYVTTSN